MSSNGESVQFLEDDENVIRLSKQSAKRVLELMKNPPKPNKRLRAPAAAYRKLVKSGQYIDASANRRSVSE
jgi:uncharacterized protein (DUF1778 family)